MGLREYRAKRDFARTPEPLGGRTDGKRLAFVVQKHAASHLHYDFRLELNGVLISWAVPKGPCLDPSEKRLAVQVEDHPFDYRNFEGTIPEGEYGGGTVMVWDRGHWHPQGDPAQGLHSGKLNFSLQGAKLSGSWSLVRLSARAQRGKKPNWLLIKGDDDSARPLSKGDILEEEDRSALTDRSLEEIAAGKPKRKSARRPTRLGSTGASRLSAPRKSQTKKARKGAKRTVARKERAPTLRSVTRRMPLSRARILSKASLAAVAGARQIPLQRTPEPQLATLVSEPPEGDEWLHEMKLDGYRMLCLIERGKARFISRNNKDWTARFPHLADAAAGLQVESALLDGEVVVLSPKGISNFQALQNALASGRDHSQIIFFAFDVLYLDGFDLTGAALLDRKSVLEELIENSSSPAIHYSEHIVGLGGEVHQRACAGRLEGIVSKRSQAPYRPGRGTDWLKSKCRQTQEFVIGGYTQPTGSRVGFGALLLGYYTPEGQFSYAGRVGTGFDQRSLRDLHNRLRALERKTSPFVCHVGRRSNQGVHWVDPRLVAQIEFSNWTDEGLLRQGAFQGLREDKRAIEVTAEEAISVSKPKSDAKRTPKSSLRLISRNKRSTPPLPPGVRLTHPDRLIFPEQGITKRDLAEYYVQIADWILPHATGRLLSMVRCPDGSKGKCFFQKHPPQGMPEQIQRVPVEEKNEVDTYVVINDIAGLVALVQFGVLEIHLWGSRADNIERPDRLIFDLDPDPAVGWNEVIQAAMDVRRLLESIELASFVKTSGGKGLHIVVPVTPEYEWRDVKPFCRAIAEYLTTTHPHRYIARSTKAARSGRIFIDYLRNDRGATAISPYSPRARAGAPVAVPVAWNELSRLSGPAHFTVENTLARLARLRKDPWDSMTRTKQSIPLERFREA